MARGAFEDGRTLPKISIAFEQATFDEINNLWLAEKDSMSFAAKVRNLTVLGLAIERFAKYADDRAKEFEYEAATCGVHQVQIVPDPQLSRLKAQHWRIIAKAIREAVGPQT